MANPAADIANAHIDDVLATQRQREIEDVVVHLAQFAPTQVAVEHPHHDHASLERRYRSFVDTQQLHSRSEIEQLGFRVAAASGIERLSPIDVTDVFYEPRIERLIAESSDHAARWDALRRAADASVREAESALRRGTIGSALRMLNSAGAREAALAPYLDHLLPICTGDDWAGADMVANWYRRNIRIALNLARTVEDGDRVLVLYGAGHAPVLEHLWRATTGYKLLDPLDYLPSA